MAQPRDVLPVDGASDSDMTMSPYWKCQCGGRYALGYDKPTPLSQLECVVKHTLPFCARYNAIVTTDDAVRFSVENRKALGEG